MAGPFQCSVRVKHESGKSCTEVYAGNYASHETAMTGFQLLMEKRVRLLGQNYMLSKLRVSDLTNNARDAYVKAIPPTYGRNPHPSLTLTDYGDVLFNRLYLRCMCEGFTKWGGKFLAGNPDDVCRNGGDMDLIATSLPWWFAALGDYITAVLANERWGIFSQNPAQAVRTIQSITMAGTKATITTSENHGFAAGDIVVLKGGNLEPWIINGRYRVLGAPSAPGATTFTIDRVNLAYDGDLIVANYGKVVKEAKIFAPFKKIEPEFFTGRKGERPSDGPRGARRAVRRKLAA